MKARVNYGEYMASREWALKKKAIQERSGGTCERCGIRPHENTHHLNYDRLGNESLTDLIGLCRPCHAFMHAESSFDPIAAAQPEPFDPGAAGILETFGDRARNLPTDSDAVANFNTDIQSVISTLQTTSPRTATHLAQIKLTANQRLYAAKRVLER